jgi:hypothetical protein
MKTMDAETAERLRELAEEQELLMQIIERQCPLIGRLLRRLFPN